MAHLTTELLPAGTYYIGDPCYVLHNEWGEICDVICSREFKERDWVLVLADGRKVAMAHTEYGDGEYWDREGNAYGVDAGLLGAIKLSDIDLTNTANLVDCGHVHVM